MTYTVADFGLEKSGPQFALLDRRLNLHGFTSRRLTDTPKNRIQQVQYKLGYSGANADGLLGRYSWAFLQTDPFVNLDPFKVTLPIGEPEKPREVFPIDAFEYDPWFVQNADGTVDFRARVDGVSTSGSSYARSELREMVPKSWSVSDGKRHRLLGLCQILEMPGRKTDDYTPGVVFGQVHDTVDDVVILMADITGRVIVEEGLGPGNGSIKHVMLTGYQLGDELNYWIDATSAGTDVTINGKRIHLDRKPSGAYSKAGCYLRGNTSNATGRGHVRYKALGTSHA